MSVIIPWSEKSDQTSLLSVEFMRNFWVTIKANVGGGPSTDYRRKVSNVIFVDDPNEIMVVPDGKNSSFSCD